ncbi:MAG: hypothetical protein ABI488_16135 [Polyangiaceae bacterium]
MTHQDDMAFEETEDRFYAQFDSRDVKLMTLDELTEAFEGGLIHENTFVCREGESEWLTLAVVAGLGEEEEPEAAPPPVVVAGRRPPMPQRTVELAPSVASESRPPMPERRPAMQTMPASRMQQAVAPSVIPVVSSMPLSFAPVASDIDYDTDALTLRPKRRWGGVLAAAAVLTLVGGGAAFALGGGAHAFASAQPSTPALPLDTKPSEPAAAAAAPVAPAASPEPVAAVAPVPAADAPSTAPNLSDDMKAALLAQDKTHAVKHAAKAKARAASGGGVSVARHGKAAASAGLKSGGSAYDPLNGKL